MSSITSKSSKATVLTRVRALIAGTEKHFSTTAFVLGKTAYTAATLTEALQSLANAIVRLNALHASVKDAVMELRAIETQVAPLMRDYQRVVLAAFSTGAQELADFGMQPPKARTPMDSEKRAVAVAKMRATRKARGTMSRKQKLAIKGDVTGVHITPVTRTEASSPSGTPAESDAQAPGSASK
jgi:hypothetical protein